MKNKSSKKNSYNIQLLISIIHTAMSEFPEVNLNTIDNEEHEAIREDEQGVIE